MHDALIGLISSAATLLLALAGLAMRSRLGNNHDRGDRRPPRQVQLCEWDRALWQGMATDLHGLRSEVREVLHELVEERREAAVRAARTEEQLRHYDC